MLKDRGFDPSEILVPTAGGPDSELSADIARSLATEFGSAITPLHVADSIEEGSTFLNEWAENRDLADADRRVETGDVEAAIEQAASENSMLIIGATERGLLSRLVRGTLVLDVVDDVDCSVVLAERTRHRSVVQRLIGK